MESFLIKKQFSSQWEVIHGPVLTTGAQKESIDVSPKVLQDIWLTPHGTELKSESEKLKTGEGTSPWEF